LPRDGIAGQNLKKFSPNGSWTHHVWGIILLPSTFSNQSCACCLLGLIINPEDGGSTSLQNVTELLLDCIVPCPARWHSFWLQFVQLLLCSLIIFTYEFCFSHFLPFFLFPVACIIIFCISAQLYASRIMTRFHCSWIVVMWEQWLLFRDCALELLRQSARSHCGDWKLLSCGIWWHPVW
jgi:hypothetical protein